MDSPVSSQEFFIVAFDLQQISRVSQSFDLILSDKSKYVLSHFERSVNHHIVYFMNHVRTNKKIIIGENWRHSSFTTC